MKIELTHDFVIHIRIINHCKWVFEFDGMDCTEESHMWWMVVGRDECESLGFELTWEKKQDFQWCNHSYIYVKWVFELTWKKQPNFNHTITHEWQETLPVCSYMHKIVGPDTVSTALMYIVGITSSWKWDMLWVRHKPMLIRTFIVNLKKVLV